MAAVRRALVAATVTGLVLAVPMPVLAHGLVGRLVSPLPLVVYVTGAALAVALSFAFVLLREQREPEVASGRPVRAPRWLVLAIKAIGLDTASIDYGQSQLFETHRALYEHNIPGLENLANLDRLPARGASLIALPMKIKGGSGAPLRAIAMLTR